MASRAIRGLSRSMRHSLRAPAPVSPKRFSVAAAGGRRRAFLHRHGDSKPDLDQCVGCQTPAKPQYREGSTKLATWCCHISLLASFPAARRHKVGATICDISLFREACLENNSLIFVGFRAFHYLQRFVI